MFERILKLPLEGTQSIFLFGPRGTGKTSYIKENLKSDLYLDLLDFSLYSTLSARPDRLENLIPPGYQKWVIIDEVQRVPELLNEVHRLIEHKKIKFLLTGSSARSLRRAGVNLLAGRALRYHMHPLTIQEVGASFNLERALHYGLLPTVLTHPDPAKYLESYVQMYLKEEVFEEGITRKIALFTRFLQVASFSQGQVLNYSEIAREAGVNRALVSTCFDILEDLLIASRITAFSLRAKRKVVSHQKFYYFDAGVYNTMRPRGPLDSLQEIGGAALETIFFQSLRAINDYYELGYTISFWRTLDGKEVDFILYGPRGLHAFEIKSSETITPKTLSGLKSFHEEYPEARLHLIYLGKHQEYHGPVTALPFEQALQSLPSLLS